MADGLPPLPPTAHDEPVPPRSPDTPQPLTDIRVKGPGGKGLNKPAVMIAAGGGVAIILVLATGSLSPDQTRKPVDSKPLMSTPARAEIGQGAVRNLPVSYEQASIQQDARSPAQPPVLGPPLPGDVAAFAPTSTQIAAPPADDWSRNPTYTADAPIDPGIAEAQLAERSQLFFALRQEPKTSSALSGQPSATAPDQMTHVRQPQSEPQPITSPSQRALFPGTVIPASLVTAINSESPGPVIAQITQTIYDSQTGRTLIIPQGARLIGAYTSGARYGQSRIAIFWSRIIMPNGDEIPLDEAALDPSGAAGVGGKVDNHWWDVFGAAALGTMINIGVASTEDPQLTYGGVGIFARDPVEQAINDGVQRTASIVSNRVVDRSLAIPPSIHVEAGKRITVLVTRRLQLK